ncbi:hypothetical protein A3J15_03440 [Candidatus Roizmanbacteria bacterium RIFCSPLOWO2_02_FULL_38_10]|uniref:Four helix bundle protein n=1 Tax=Candidatus Roizmanbacteria bacterium RIFCSPLOWO2_02_FULL_38_10 TaxID=1802074 RepID=A0A1F7JNX8_9BACT|nr:MAG: hypothetical protein A3J15_03440 [Candidatus Roizmanbacteria bacterium RIFCSPLOWO2_02_FULL_38_10]
MTNMNTFRFRKFKVYQDSLKFRKEIRYLIDTYFPKKELYLLSDQLLRATNSVILNIAEGTDRSTDKDFANFLNKSQTSINEIVSCFDIALVDNYISEKVHDDYLFKAIHLVDQLTAFRNKLLKFPSK